MPVAPIIILDLLPAEWLREPQRMLADPRIRWHEVSRASGVAYRYDAVLGAGIRVPNTQHPAPSTFKGSPLVAIGVG
ncbi:MAG: hypothetical protein HY719_07435 [Planctomycetes bacterium]|nr:hypothetical protein [Planctomycetota bacterium]